MSDPNHKRIFLSAVSKEFESYRKPLGPMPLFQADILLTRVRPCFRTDRAAARDDLALARTLIERHGYGRRTQELEDAEAAIGG